MTSAVTLCNGCTACIADRIPCRAPCCHRTMRNASTASPKYFPSTPVNAHRPVMVALSAASRTIAITPDFAKPPSPAQHFHPPTHPPTHLPPVQDLRGPLSHTAQSCNQRGGRILSSPQLQAGWGRLCMWARETARACPAPKPAPVHRHTHMQALPLGPMWACVYLGVRVCVPCACLRRAGMRIARCDGTMAHAQHSHWQVAQTRHRAMHCGYATMNHTRRSVLCVSMVAPGAENRDRVVKIAKGHRKSRQGSENRKRALKVAKAY